MIGLHYRFSILLLLVMSLMSLLTLCVGVLLPEAGQIAYQLQRGRTRALYLLDVARRTSHELARGSDPFPNYTWSPDGKQLAYVARDDNQADIFRVMVECPSLWAACPATANLTHFREADTEPTWSPDSTQIVFVSERNGTPELYWMPASGTEAYNLTQDSATDSFPIWSPDGRYIAFYSDRSGTLQTYKMDMTCLSSVDQCAKMIFRVGGGFNGIPAWSPDGDHLAYFANGDIMIVPAACSKGTTDCSATSSNLTRSTSTDWFPVWSPDGTRLYFQSNRSGEPQIYSADMRCEWAINDCTHPLKTGLTYSLLPSFSFSGQQIALNAVDSGFSELYLIPYEGAPAERLTFTGGQITNIRWRPQTS